MSCEFCRFWKRIGEDGNKCGECRKHSPVQCVHGYVYDPADMAMSDIRLICEHPNSFVASTSGEPATPIIRMGWPFTKPDDFCGDFAAK